MPSRPAPSFRPAGAATPFIEATAGAASSVVFGLASFIRRARVFHPVGVAFSATVDVPAAGVLPVGSHDAVLRFSRGAGLPEAVPDILGLALRIVDLHGPGRHQDLLLVTSGSSPGTRHALVPARTFGHHRWSTLLPYEVGGRRVVFGARPSSSALDGARRLEDLRRLADHGVRFALDVAEPRGDWEEVAAITIGRERTDEENEGLRFNPANTGGGIEPVGVLQTIRRRAYRGSQEGRPTPG
jgi:hypothetical protein